MKIDFEFTNLLGTVYRQGNLVFTPDGSGLVSPVGNRVTYFDLMKNKSHTFAYEHRKNIARICLNPQGTLLLSIDTDGRGILVNFHRRNVIHHFNFKDRVADVKFSPKGEHFAVAVGRHVQVWETPRVGLEKQFAPFILHRVYTGHFAPVTSINWSGDSRFFITGSKDLSCKVFSLDAQDKVASTTLAGHREPIIGSFFSKNQEIIYTVSRDGALFQWEYIARRKDDDDDDEMSQSDNDDEEEKDMRWRVTARHYFLKNSKLRCSAFHPETNILVAGFGSGIFSLYELPNFSEIHTLSISQEDIDNVTINQSGEWLAFGASKLGQLLVWEWQSESYILKQQGHFDGLNCLTYSRDGSRIVSGSDDGKIKVWDAQESGFCIVTFDEHTSGVTGVEFAKSKGTGGNLLFSSSLDGSVRAWDLIRYRNFRTFTAPSRVQFTCIAVDPSGEIVCAGSMDGIYVWSVQTGQLLDQLQGHEGPISCISFSHHGGVLASASWDKTVRIWDVFHGRTRNVEPFQLSSDVLAVSVNPSGDQVCVASLDGLITIWDIIEGKQVGEIDGKRDIRGGRYEQDRFSAENSSRSKYFTSLCYSGDGSCIIAGGISKYICLYDLSNQVLLKKYQLSQNMGLEGTIDILNSKQEMILGIDETGEASDLEDRIDKSLPGASRGDFSRRKSKREIKTAQVEFCPSGGGFACATTEGIMIFNNDRNNEYFDPTDLDIDITPTNTIKVLKQEKNYLKALIMALRLGEEYLIIQCYEATPIQNIQLVVKDLPIVYLNKIIHFISNHSMNSKHLEFNLLWIHAILSYHGLNINKQQQRQENNNAGNGDMKSNLRELQRSIIRIQKDIAGLANHTSYSVDYLISARKS